jgi:preprotein translocase SecF subunit
MALIKSFPIAPKLNFMAKRKLFLALSALLMLGSILSVAILGLNFGVDFRGGILLEVRTDGPANLGELRSRLSSLNVGEVTLQEFGEPTDVLINIQQQDGNEEAQNAAIQIVKTALGADVVEYRRTEFVGPKVGGELKEAGILATVLALVAIGIYIWFRFEWQFSAAALIALLHDVIATVGFFALTQVEFNLSTLAAVLTIAGYSINDTVVIFDRVRDELRKYKKMPIVELLDMSINRTLSRTVLTSFTTLLALISLFVFGGEVIRGFSMGLIWGIVIGTYSSIALAVPILSYMNIRAGERDEKGQPEQSAATAS